MASNKKYDIAIVGAGPGGYVAAIKAAQTGKKIALIEKGHLGGTCLNVGCIPSKALLANASMVQQIKRASEFGISVENVSFDYSKMNQRKNEVVSSIRSSLGGLIKANLINIFHGSAQFESQTSLKIIGQDNLVIDADKIIIATGSQPVDIGAFPCDHQKILNSTSALALSELPKSIAIVGGGYIGCEFASLYSALGVKVTIIEALSSIVEAQGRSISQALTQAFNEKGIVLKTNTKVLKINNSQDGLTITLSQNEQLEVDKAVICVGRALNTKDLKLENIGLSTESNGSIKVDEKMETQIPGIYAIGDITSKAMLAHVASHQGIVAATNACGGSAKMHYNAIPAVIFTSPEIASVGLTEEEALKKGLSFKVGKYPFKALGKSIATNDTNGFAQVIADKETGEIYGAQVVGKDASSLIGEMAIAIANELTLECVSDTVHAHPTLPEAWLEASLIANETPIHFPPKISKKG